MVVHREAEEDDKEERWHPGGDAAGRLEAEGRFAPAPLEGRDEEAVGGADGEQVEQDRLQRDHD